MEDIFKFFGGLILVGLAIIIISIIVVVVSSVGIAIGSTVGFMNYVKAFRSNVYFEKPHIT